MSTFAELAARGNGVGVMYTLDGSDDLFATTSHLFSTVDLTLGGTITYDARILELGDLQRGFGTDGTLAASTVSIRLSNIDGGLDDFLTDPVTLFTTRWKLRVLLFDAANPSDIDSKVLGEFVNLDYPVRDGTTVVLSLADDSFGAAAELAIPPTPSEAFAAALDATTSEPPVPIALGGQTIPALASSYPPDATSIDFVLTATTDTDAVDPDDMESLLLSGGPLNNTPFGYEGGVLPVGPVGTYTEINTASPGNPGTVLQVPLWELKKTASLAKDGRTWRVMYVTIYVENLLNWLTANGYLDRNVSITGISGSTVTVNYVMPLATFNAQVLPAITIEAVGRRWASRTYTETGLVTTVRGPDIAYDLLRYYSRGLEASQVDQDSFVAATSAAPMFYFKASVYFTNFTQNVDAVSDGGALGRRTQPSIATTAQGLLRRAVSDLCQGGLFDVVTDWNGKFVAHLLANSFELQTETPTEVDETLMANVTDKVPSPGERWAPYNRIIFASNGRIVDNRTAIEEWGQVLPRTINDAAVELETAFSGTDFGIGTFGGIGTLESVIRPVISFDYPLDALNWELGDFISITWSRGASGLTVWSGALFRIEDLVLHPARCTVSVKAVWIEDLADSLPYLLDDETLLVRSKVGSGSVTTDGSNFTFGGTINLSSIGVVEGDIIVLRDSTQAADVFTRNVALRIVGVNSSTDLDVSDSVPLAVVANADWYIVRGATTYPTVLDDPTNYPSGGRMYGKLSEDGTFSNGTTANTLQAG